MIHWPLCKGVFVCMYSGASIILLLIICLEKWSKDGINQVLVSFTSPSSKIMLDNMEFSG